MIKTLSFRLTSEAPLLMHNGKTTTDPLNKFTKAIKQITSKKKKTDADYMELARLEWLASLYPTADGKLCIPSEVSEATIISGAKLLKLGTDAKRTVCVLNDSPFHFDGENLTIDQLWERDQNRLTVKARPRGQGTVMRTRARFDKWYCDITVRFDDKILDPAQIREILKRAGQEVGLCDWRPKFGRFSVEEI